MHIVPVKPDSISLPPYFPKTYCRRSLGSALRSAKSSPVLLVSRLVVIVADGVARDRQPIHIRCHVNALPCACVLIVVPVDKTVFDLDVPAFVLSITMPDPSLARIFDPPPMCIPRPPEMRIPAAFAVTTVLLVQSLPAPAAHESRNVAPSWHCQASREQPSLSTRRTVGDEIPEEQPRRSARRMVPHRVAHHQSVPSRMASCKILHLQLRPLRYRPPASEMCIARSPIDIDVRHVSVGGVVNLNPCSQDSGLPHLAQHIDVAMHPD